MFHKHLLMVALIAGSTSAAFADIETVTCKNPADADKIVSSALAEPSLEDGQAATTAALVQDLVQTGACVQIVMDDSNAAAATTPHPVDRIVFGTVDTVEGRAIAMDFVSDFF